MVTGNNNRTPVEVVRLFIETTTKLFEQNKEAIEHNTNEIKDLRECLTKAVNILNQNPSNAEIEGKLDISITQTNTMITSVKVAVALIVLCGVLAVFGSQVLFKAHMNKELAKNKQVVESPREEKTSHPDWIIEKMENLERKIKECREKEGNEIK